jgi:hypothetical protein
MPLRVLLITPEFYGIEKIIKSVLEKSDYEVTWFENKTLSFDYHGTKSKFKFLRRLYFLICLPKFRYIRKELKTVNNLKYDVLFAVNAHIVCNYLFRKLKNENPGLYSVLYLWDSFSMFNWTKELRFFNKVYTFDRDDSIKYKIEYKPNFYIKGNNNAIHKTEFDLFFVGKFSPERLTRIDKMLNLSDDSEIQYFIRLWPGYKMLFHNHFIYGFIKKFNFKRTWVKDYILNYEAFEGIIRRDFLVTNSLDHEAVQHNLLCSNVILDLPYKLQTGYTHRLIEALANGKKIITTNSRIREEAFYDARQIRIIDEKNQEIDLNWIREKSTFPIQKNILDLELSKWLKSIIDVAVV